MNHVYLKALHYERTTRCFRFKFIRDTALWVWVRELTWVPTLSEFVPSPCDGTHFKLLGCLYVTGSLLPQSNFAKVFGLQFSVPVCETTTDVQLSRVIKRSTCQKTNSHQGKPTQNVFARPVFTCSDFFFTPWRTPWTDHLSVWPLVRETAHVIMVMPTRRHELKAVESYRKLVNNLSCKIVNHSISRPFKESHSQLSQGLQTYYPTHNRMCLRWRVPR